MLTMAWDMLMGVKLEKVYTTEEKKAMTPGLAVTADAFTFLERRPSNFRDQKKSAASSLGRWVPTSPSRTIETRLVA